MDDALIYPHPNGNVLAEKVSALEKRMDKTDETKGELWQAVDGLRGGIRELSGKMDGVQVGMTALRADLQAVTETMQSREREANQASIVTHRWVIGILVTLILALLGTYVFVK